MMPIWNRKHRFRYNSSSAFAESSYLHMSCEKWAMFDNAVLGGMVEDGVVRFVLTLATDK